MIAAARAAGVPLIYTTPLSPADGAGSRPPAAIAAFAEWRSQVISIPEPCPPRRRNPTRIKLLVPPASRRPGQAAQRHGGLRARAGTAVVHRWLRHPQRGLLSARRYPTDPRSRVYRRRPRRGRRSTALHIA